MGRPEAVTVLHGTYTMLDNDHSIVLSCYSNGLLKHFSNIQFFNYCGCSTISNCMKIRNHNCFIDIYYSYYEFIIEE